MDNSTADDFFSPRHKQLMWIATLANIFSWIVIGLYLLMIVYRIMGDYNAILNQLGTLQRFLAENMPDAIYLLINYLSLILQGAIWWLALRGISLAMNMLVETDINYRDKIQGEAHE
jgi:hypothetical protein